MESPALESTILDRAALHRGQASSAFAAFRVVAEYHDCGGKVVVYSPADATEGIFGVLKMRLRNGF
jgi:hypothetical protein